MNDNVIHAISGAGGGIISMVITYPLMTISSRLQVQHASNEGEKYKGNIDALNKITKAEGLSGLYAGVESAVFGSAVSNGAYYYFFEASRKVVMRILNIKKLNTAESLLVGSVAGAMTAIISNPIWVVNTRLSVKGKTATDSDPPSSFQEFKNIIKNDGIFALWQGIKPALVLVINPVIQYTIFEQLKNEIQQFRPLGSFDHFALGAVSKLFATFITYPYILLKSRLQLKQSNSEKESSTSMIGALKKIVLTRGIKGLYSGIESKLLQSVLTAAILFMTKDSIYKLTVRIVAILSARKLRLEK